MKLTTKYDMLSSHCLDSVTSLFQAKLAPASAPSSAAMKEKTWRRASAQTVFTRASCASGAPRQGSRPSHAAASVRQLLLVGDGTAGSGPGVRQARGCDRDKLRDPAADPRGRGTQQ